MVVHPGSPAPVNSGVSASNRLIRIGSASKPVKADPNEPVRAFAQALVPLESALSETLTIFDTVLTLIMLVWQTGKDLKEKWQVEPQILGEPYEPRGKTLHQAARSVVNRWS
ncbi:protein of unknown function (plasmid) [Paraburkholderia kururiensis]